MGFKAISTRRTSATSAVSNQATVINTGTGNLSVGGSLIKANTSITLGVTTPGQSSANSAVTASGGPTITSLTYLDVNNNPTSANAVSTSGGNIKVTGTGFATNPSVYINNSLVTNTFVSSTEIRAVCPAASAGNVSLFIFNTTNVGALSGTPVRYSGAPTWTTAAVSFQNGSAANVQLVASSDSTLTFTLQAGSTLPTGIDLISTGYLSGTATGYSNATSSTATIIATDAEGQATQQTLNITVTTSDPQFPYTTLLLNGDTGTNTGNAATNNTFLDSSSGNITLTRNGNATQGTFSPYSQTGWSNYFNGSTDYQSFAANANTVLGSNDFTIEAMMYFNDVSTDHTLIYWNANVSGYAAVHVKQTSGKWALWMSTSGGAWAVQQSALGSTITPGTWYHVAVVRSGTNVKLYINGSDVTSGGYTVSGSLMSTYTLNQIGVYNTSSYLMAGYISNLRLVNGTAIVPAAGGPTSPLTAVANTQLLICQSNRFKDNSPNGFTATLGGTPSIQAVSPFSPGASYSPSSYGGGMYLDGSTDYLSNSNNTTALQLSTGDYTIEYWIYPTSFAVLAVHWDFRTSNGASGGAIQIYTTTGGIVTVYGGSSTGTLLVTAAAAIPLNAWTHIALTRASNATKLFINGNQSGSTYASDTTSYGLGGLWLGAIASGGNNYVTGYMSDARVVKGTAVYTTTFTPPTSPLTAISGTSLLCSFANGAIVDAHSSNVLETGGDTKLSTVVKKFGNASIYFDGTGDYLECPLSQNFSQIGSWTIEMWIYPTASNNCYIYSQNTTNFLQFNLASNMILYVDRSGVGNIITAGAAISLNTWTHIALVSESTTVKLYINGTQSGSTANYSTVTASATTTRIGAYQNSGGAATFPYSGYIDDLRVTKGFARYTANFTAPTTAFLGQ